MSTSSRGVGLSVSVAGALMVTFAVVVAAAAIWHFRPIALEADVANGLAGERWYGVTFRHTPIGHYRSQTGRTDDGDFEFRSVLQFKLGDGETTRMEDRFVFHRRPPHRLLRAEHAASRSDIEETRVIIADQTANVIEHGASRQLEVDSDLELGDYLSVQSWLAAAAPSPGEVHTARSIDFDTLSISTDRWKIVSADADGVEVAKEAATAESAPRATRIRLDSHFAPLRMESDDHISLHRVPDETTARVWEQTPSLFASASHVVAVDRPIDNPQALQRLVVGVDVDDGDHVDWPSSSGPGLLTAVADPRTPATSAELAVAASTTVSYPATAPEVQLLAQRAVGDLAGEREKANALTFFVHHHLRYRDTAGGRTVIDTIRDKSGDCTEFADLYTTLARATGLAARTVIGLAYQSETQAFALHAWNEVAIDGFWRSLDPTWGDTRVGATHFALPTERSLAAIAQLPHMRFRVVETHY